MTSVDNQTRERIANELDRNFLVEASAGTGKTTSIVGRMVNLVARGECEMSQLAAVTFTHKAAAELRERFHVGLQSAQSEERRPQSEVERLQVAAQQVDRVFVGTFHAFCSMLLHERPIESGVEPAFRGMEEPETLELRDQAWLTFLADLHATNDGRLAKLHELGLKPDKVRAAFNRYVDYPDIEVWPTEEKTEIDFDEIRKYVEAYIERIAPLMEDFPDDRGNDKLMSHYESIVRRAGNRRLNNVAELMEVLQQFERKKNVVQKMWADKATAKNEKDIYERFRTEFAVPRLSQWYQYRYAFLIGLLRDAADIFEQTREQSGGLSFNDLLLKMSASLRMNPQLRRYFQNRFTHLLVDEFQDTDPIQAEILAFLTSEDVDEQDWTKCKPRPGALFLVGDPKQSIYRFRRADIVTYNQMRKVLEDAGGEVLKLVKNFRTVTEIREWGNAIFDDLLSGRSEYSPAASAMEQGRADAEDGDLKGVCVLSIPEESNRTVDDAVRFEAEAIARYISDCIATKQTVPRTQKQLDAGRTAEVEPGDFMIVTPTKKRLHLYAAALDRLGVPNTVSGSNPFVEIAELKFLLNCLRAVDDSRNPVPYVALLRGASLGFSDADLFQLRRCGGRFNYTSPLPDGLDAALAARYASVNDRLVRFRNWLRTLPFPSAIERILHDVGLLAQAVSRDDGNVKAGGLLKAVEWMRIASRDFDSAVDAITFLEELSANSEASGCTVLPPTTSHVRLMNIHKAKGLEAPVVFLANPAGSAHEPHFHVDRTVCPPRGYFVMSDIQFKPYRVETMIACPSEWETFKEEEAKFHVAERVRLLYVAVTRAGSQLVVTQRPGNKNAKHLWAPLDKYLDEATALEFPSRVDAFSTELPSAPEKDLEATRVELHEKWAAAQQATYGVVAAKRLALSKQSRPDWQVRGSYGEGWGSAVHELLETAARNPGRELESKAMRLCETYNLPVKRVDELVDTVNSVFESEIWQRAQAAGRVLYEVPFELPQELSRERNDGNHGNVSTIELPSVIKGVIDLVFQEADGWVIVDYKTDAMSATDLKSAADYYRFQLQAYSEFWQQMTGEKVLETGLFFTRLKKYVAFGE